MSDHDPLCTYGPEWDRMKGGARGCPECALIDRVRAEYTDWVAPGQHDAVVATAEARARADERERNREAAAVELHLAQESHLAALEARDNELVHAEQVAARLVEVICEQDILLREWVAERKRLEPMLAARADADYCTAGCDLPLTSCLAHRAETGGKCCPECQHPAEAQAFAALRERIAQEIEEQADDFGFDEIVRAFDDLNALRDVVKDALHAAAAIARGGAQ